MSEKIEPCKKCGNENVNVMSVSRCAENYFGGVTSYFVHCPECEEYKTEAEAIAAWNKRQGGNDGD